MAVASSPSGAPHDARRRRGRLRQVGRTGRLQRLLQLLKQLSDAARLDRLDLQPRQAHFQPLQQFGELFAFRQVGRRRRRLAVGGRRSLGGVDPRLGAGAEEQRVLEALRLAGRATNPRRAAARCRRRGRSGPTCSGRRRTPAVSAAARNSSQPISSWYFSCEPTYRTTSATGRTWNSFSRLARSLLSRSGVSTMIFCASEGRSCGTSRQWRRAGSRRSGLTDSW